MFGKHKVSRSLVLFLLVFGSVAGNMAAAQKSGSTPWFSSTAQSNNAVFTTTLIATEPALALNRFLIWELTVTDAASGEPVTPARISVGGGMPLHGHGLPSQPQVTEYLEGGRYRVEGLKFNMLGQWVLQFDITTKSASDTVIFEFALDY